MRSGSFRPIRKSRAQNCRQLIGKRKPKKTSGSVRSRAAVSAKKEAARQGRFRLQVVTSTSSDCGRCGRSRNDACDGASGYSSPSYSNGEHSSPSYSNANDDGGGDANDGAWPGGACARCFVTAQPFSLAPSPWSQPHRASLPEQPPFCRSTAPLALYCFDYFGRKPAHSTAVLRRRH